MVRALVVDDEINICRSIEMVLSKDGYSVAIANSVALACSLIEENDFDIIFTDLRLADASGLDVLSFARQKRPSAQVIVITGFATIETAVEAIRRGAYDYLTKPLTPDTIRVSARRALEKTALREEIHHLRQELSQCFGFENLIGRSRKMQEVFKIIRQTSGSDSNVLITGESGTGKELVARAIHYNSGRRNHRFVPVNCGAIARELIESELFGYVKGAFTGAARDRVGFFELASLGTLFLDEIGETSPDFQVKLLRVLQEGEFHKVGTPHATKVDVRVIAATNRDMESALAEGRFREDLFYRLNVISVRIPPLRHRREDIPLLVLHFIEKFARKRAGAPIRAIEPSALEVLMQYPYPGNVRELENIIEYAVAFSSGATITQDDLPSAVRAYRAPAAKMHLKPLRIAKYEFERSFLLAALRECQGNISKTARLLDVHRQRLQQKIKDLDIQLDSLQEEKQAQ